MYLWTGYLCMCNVFLLLHPPSVFPPPLTGCHLLASHLFVAHRLTASSTDCFLMAAASVFHPFLALPFHPLPQCSNTNTWTSQKMKMCENKGRKIGQGKWFCSFSPARVELCVIFIFLNIYSTDSSSAADHTHLFLKQFLEINHKWLIGNGYKCYFQSL